MHKLKLIKQHIFKYTHPVIICSYSGEVSRTKSAINRFNVSFTTAITVGITSRVPMNVTHLSWITPTLPLLVTTTWAPDPSQHGAHDPRIDEFGNFKGKVHHPITHPPGKSNIAQHKQLSTLNPLILRSSVPILAGSTNTPLRTPSTKPLNGLLLPQGIL